MSLKDTVAVVGVGTIYLPPAQSKGFTAADLGILAAQAALDDAGLSREELQGFAGSSGSIDPGAMAAQMGVPEVSFSANLSSGAGGGAGALGLAAAAVAGGFADVCLTLISVQLAPSKPGRTSSGTRPRPVAGPGAYGGPTGPDPDAAFSIPAGITTQAESFAMTANRYMYQYGVTREHLAEVCISQWENATHLPESNSRRLTLDEYLGAPMVVDPLSTFDCSPEPEGSFAVAAITTTVERSRDLRQPPVVISAAVTGGSPGQATPFQLPDEDFASSGHREIAKALYEMGGIGPADIDVALLYDDYSPMVLMQLEDYGFCGIGEAGPFVAGGGLRYSGGRIPVNTHGGNLTEAYSRGATHVVEAVDQIRGTSRLQVSGCEAALVTGSPGLVPFGAAILRKA